MEGDSRV